MFDIKFTEENRGLHFSLLKNSKHIGSMHLMRHDEDPKVCIIDEFGINPEYQRKGIGAKFLNDVEETYLRDRCRRLYVFAEPRSLIFWEKMGYGNSAMEYNERELEKVRKMINSKNTDALTKYWEEYGGFTLARW